MGNTNNSSNYVRTTENSQADSDLKDMSNKVVIEYPNGDIYEGDVIQSSTSVKTVEKGAESQEEGKGKQVVDNTRIGLREGYGRFIARDRKNHRNYEYVGDWLDNMRHGQGRCYFYNGDLYQGQWEKGKRSG